MFSQFAPETLAQKDREKVGPCRRLTNSTRRTSVSIVKVGLCGHGYWGQNLLRTFSGDPRFEVVAVSDIRESARDGVRRTSTAIRLYADGTEVVDDPEVEAVAIATPAATHFSLARQALLRKKHVLVEKPMCASVAEAQELVALAEKNGV